MEIVWPIFVMAFGFRVFCVSWSSWISWISCSDSGVPGLLLSRQVSLYSRPEMHLFATLENSTLRRDCDLLRQVFDKVLLSIPGLFDAIGLFTVEELVETEAAKFIIVGFDFATILLSLLCSCILFAIVLVQLVKLKF